MTRRDDYPEYAASDVPPAVVNELLVEKVSELPASVRFFIEPHHVERARPLLFETVAEIMSDPLLQARITERVIRRYVEAGLLADCAELRRALSDAANLIGSSHT